MNIIDRVAGGISPRWGLRRTQARLALIELRKFTAADKGRRGANWMTRPTSADSEIAQDLHLLRDRTRDMVRNNAYAKKAKAVWVNNAVGEGIKPKGDGTYIDLFDEWSDLCDADGGHDFYGLQALAAKTEWESGEALVRFRSRRPSDRLPVPFQLQLLEPDHIDTSKHEEIATGIIINGVEFNHIGQRVAYWLFPTHPGDAFPYRRGSFKSKRVPANQLTQVFRRERPGQTRGFPAASVVLMLLRDMSERADAKMMKDKIEACFAAFVTQVGDAQSAPAAGLLDKDKKIPTRTNETVSPGIIKYLSPGEDVKFGEPSSSAGYAETMKLHAHEVAAGFEVAYHLMTGDVSNANYTALRAARLDLKSAIKPYQNNVLIHQMCRPVWRMFKLYCDLSGKHGVPNRVSWMRPKFEPVDELKTALADATVVRAGFRPHDDVASEYGSNTVELYDRLEKLAKLFDQKGLVLDSDPRKVAKSGLIQPDQLKD